MAKDETGALDWSRLGCRGPRELNYAERAALFTRRTHRCPRVVVPI